MSHSIMAIHYRGRWTFPHYFVIGNRRLNACPDPVIGRLVYDPVATKAMIEKKSIIDYTDSLLSNQIKALWDNLHNIIKENHE